MTNLGVALHLCLITWTLTLAVYSYSWGKVKVIRIGINIVKTRKWGGKKTQADIFIDKRDKVWRGSKKKKKNVGWVYLLNKGQQNTTTKTRWKTFRTRDISVRRDEKMFSEEKCPCGRQMPKQLWQRKKGGKSERTEGTTIIYVNNVPLLLIISGKIKQKRAGGGWRVVVGLGGGCASRMSPN